MDVRETYDARNCSVARTLTALGDRWGLLVLREAYYGARRFEVFLRRVGCARNILTLRLTKLVDAGVLERSPYQEPGKRARDEYRLTPAGRGLFPAVVALMQWGDAHLATTGAPVLLTHQTCGHTVEAIVRCRKDGRRLTLADVVAQPGPGAKRSPRRRA
jgi:DNA-binding HxlR family transcriptional regulator